MVKKHDFSAGGRISLKDKQAGKNGKETVTFRKLISLESNLLLIAVMTPDSFSGALNIQSC